MGIPAKLPTHLIQKTIGDRQTLGETFYVVPWAMVVSTDLRCYLLPNHSYTWEPMGTSSLKVTRGMTGDVEVDTRRCDYHWTPQEIRMTPDGLIPVVKIVADPR